MCKFCDELSDLKECHKIAQGWATDAELTEYGKYMQELTVAFVERCWYQKKGRKSAGRTVHYRNRGLGFALNYCPECGKKIKREIQMYKYGMRLRGFSFGCQPMSGFVRREDDPTGRYHDVIVYDRQLTEQELKDYELDYLGDEIE